ncbi:MAG: threonine dehydratase [Rhodospirillales bacterium]|nr:threonine dehydratase [Rhodospirillales bacterium]
MLTLEEIETAAELVHAQMNQTPQICWPLLSERAGTEVWVKHENHTPISAFKVRGGIVYMDELKTSGAKVNGVITATRGNHGQSISLAAGRAGLPAVIVVPHGNSREKNAAMRAQGAELIEHGDDFQAAVEYAIAVGKDRNLHMVGPFEPALVKGVASYCLEFLSAAHDLDTVYVPIGMGSGICAMIQTRDALNLKTKVVGVVSTGAPAYALSFDKGEVVSTNGADTFADGVACRVPNKDALAIILGGAERVVQVSDDRIKDAMRHYFTDTHNVAEGAGAAPLAALLSERDRMMGKKAGVVLTGGGVDVDVYRDVLMGA